MQVKKLRTSTICYRRFDNCINRIKKTLTKPLQFIKRFNSYTADTTESKPKKSN